MNSLVSIDICASRLISSFFLYEFKDDGAAACRERAGKLVDIIAYESALIRRPRIIYISLTYVVIGNATRSLYIS